MPALTQQPTPAAQPQAATQPAPAAAQPEQPKVQAEPTTITAVKKQPTVEVTPTPEPPIITTKAVTSPTPQPAATPRRSPLGASLTSLLAEQEQGYSGAPTEVKQEAAAKQYDPQCAEKIEACREEVLAFIREQRPRFAPSFEQMTLDGSTIRISVPSRELHDEILRNKTLVLTGIARKAAVNGSIELEIAINETLRAARPIKLEDRVKYMTEKNPLLTDLRKQLDMEIE